MPISGRARAQCRPYRRWLAPIGRPDWASVTTGTRGMAVLEDLGGVGERPAVLYNSSSRGLTSPASSLRTWSASYPLQGVSSLPGAGPFCAGAVVTAPTNQTSCNFMNCS